MRFCQPPAINYSTKNCTARSSTRSTRPRGSGQHLHPPYVDTLDIGAVSHFDPHKTIAIPGLILPDDPAVLADPVLRVSTVLVPDDRDNVATQKSWLYRTGFKTYFIRLGDFGPGGLIEAKSEKII